MYLTETRNDESPADIIPCTIIEPRLVLTSINCYDCSFKNKLRDNIVYGKFKHKSDQRIHINNLYRNPYFMGKK